MDYIFGLCPPLPFKIFGCAPSVADVLCLTDFCLDHLSLLFEVTYYALSTLQTRQKQARVKSAEMLKKDLDKERKPGCTDYLTKVSGKSNH